MKKTFPFIALSALLFSFNPEPLAGQGEGGRGKGKKPPPLSFGSGAAPLEGAIRRLVADRAEDESDRGACKKALKNDDQGEIAKHCKCKTALEENPPDLDKIATQCKLKKLEIRELLGADCPACGEIMNSAGKRTGKKLGKKTTTQYTGPAQRNLSTWPQRVLLGKEDLGAFIGGLGAASVGGAGNRVRRSVWFPGEESPSPLVWDARNDDGDCIDVVTGEVKNSLACFGVARGQLKNQKLISNVTVHGDKCKHTATGTVIGDRIDKIDDPCFDEDSNEKQSPTSLEQLIDEDPEDQVDVDGDGFLDEDPVDGLNNDRDCLDLVTEHWKGETDCFDGTILKQTLEVAQNNEDPSIGCKHSETGIELQGDSTDGVEDNCFAADGTLKTSLVELIDEDGEEAQVDNDGDELFDEDPPDKTPLAELCVPQTFGLADLNCDPLPDDPDLQAICNELRIVDGRCDVTPVIIARINQKSSKPKDQGGRGKPLFKRGSGAGDQQPQGTDDFEFGTEPRQVTITETLTLMCEEGWELGDDDQCFRPGTVSAVAPGSAGRSAGSELATGVSTCDTVTAAGEECHKTIMGFTFAPPVLEWGFTVKEEACDPLFGSGLCWEIFFARVGYKFDIAFGLRLPIEVITSSKPAKPVLAEQELSLAAAVQPRDFKVEEYAEFCGSGTEIEDCSRFAFADVLDPWDGSEFVAREEVFAGIQVRLSEITLVDLAIDSKVDFTTICTLEKLKPGLLVSVLNQTITNTEVVRKASKSIADYLSGADPDENFSDVRTLLKKLGLNCGSFTTPFGKAPKKVTLLGETLELELPSESRPFPRLSKDKFLRADCRTALAKNEFVESRKGRFTKIIDGKPKKVEPLCSGLTLGNDRLNVGLGLGLGVLLTSKGITADWSETGDSCREGAWTVEKKCRESVPDEVIFTQSRDEAERENCEGPEECPFVACEPGQTDCPFVALGPVVADNYDAQTDEAVIGLDDFTYFLNDVVFQAKVRPELGGDLVSWLPGDIAVPFTLFEVSVQDLIGIPELGIPIGQHAGVPGVDAQVFVENYALRVEADAEEDDKVPASSQRCQETNSSKPMLKIRPGEDEEPGIFVVAVENLGSVEDTFAGFEATVVECPDAAACDASNTGEWSLLFARTTTQEIAAHTRQERALELEVKPVLNFQTGPGEYLLELQGDSGTVRDACAMQPPGQKCLSEEDPLGNRRLGARDDFCVQVLAVWNPVVTIEGESGRGKPGVELSYTARIMNGGNELDSIGATRIFLDSNTAGCGLADRGRGKLGCPFRAELTQIQDTWVVDDLRSLFGDLKPGPDWSELDRFSMRTESEWAGMEDTDYEIEITVDSKKSALDKDWLNDKGGPATTTARVALTVVATLKSMTRYIGLEIDELIEILEEAEDVATGGLGPILMHPARMNNERALEHVHSGDLEAARRAHETNTRVVEAFLHVLDGGVGRSLPDELEKDLRERANALLADVTAASTNDVAPAQCLVDDLSLSSTPSESPAVFRACRSITWGPGEFNGVSGTAPAHKFVDGFASSVDSVWSN